MAYSTRTMTDADWSEIKHFKASEFNYPDKMGYQFLKWLDAVREEAGVGMHLVSDHRPPERNAAAGGAERSAHMDVPCNAVDIKKTPTPSDPNWNHTRYKIIKAALKLGCQRIGMYPNGSLHLDRGEDTHPAPRIWIAVTS